MRKLWINTIALFGSALLLSSANAQPTTRPAADKPAADAKAVAPDGEPVTTRTRMQDFPGKKYLSMTRQSKMSDLMPDIHEMVEKLRQTMHDGGIAPSGPPIYVFKGLSQNPNQPFMLEVGAPVPDNTKDTGDFKVRDLEPFHAAGVIYSGPLAQIAQAYEQVYGDIIGGGHQPTEESRQMTLYWETPESVNNVQMIMVGVQQ